MGIPDNLNCLLRNLCAGQEATIRTRNGTTDWFKIGKGVFKVVYCHRVYLTYTQITSCKKSLGWMIYKLKSRLLQKKINNLKYADGTTLMAEREQEPKSLVMKVLKRRLKKLV